MSAGAREGVQHDAARRRFVVQLEEGTAVLEYRSVDATTLDYYHTFVPNALRGRGLASEITEFALRHALEQRLKVVPTCPFVATFISRHPEFAPVLSD